MGSTCWGLHLQNVAMCCCKPWCVVSSSQLQPGLGHCRQDVFALFLRFLGMIENWWLVDLSDRFQGEGVSVYASIYFTLGEMLVFCKIVGCMIYCGLDDPLQHLRCKWSVPPLCVVTLLFRVLFFPRATLKVGRRFEHGRIYKLMLWIDRLLERTV